jgi:hypothetical protein
MLTVPKGKMAGLLGRAFFPPVFLIGMIKGSILLGWATPSEALMTQRLDLLPLAGAASWVTRG